MKTVSKVITTTFALHMFIAFTVSAIYIYKPVFAQDLSEYEYEEGEGLHREEWYDPGDWFDDEGEGISYEKDWYGYSYTYDDFENRDISGYYGEAEDAENGYMYDYDWEYNYFTDNWYLSPDIY
ncbi:MAG: hypothetical protein R6U50_15500 [Desulfobacterales bacterium]